MRAQWGRSGGAVGERAVLPTGQVRARARVLGSSLCSHEPPRHQPNTYISQVAAEAAAPHHSAGNAPDVEAALRTALGRIQGAIEPGTPSRLTPTQGGRPSLRHARGRHGSGEIGRRERKQSLNDAISDDIEHQRLDDHLLHDPLNG